METPGQGAREIDGLLGRCVLPELTIDDFVTGETNRLVAAAARRVSDSPGGAYNPLVIHGGAGLGKTHLLAAIAHRVREHHPSIPVWYDTLQRFAESVTIAGAAELESRLLRLGHRGLWLLDDAQYAADRPDVQDVLLRVWDLLVSNGGQIVVAMDRSPHEIDGFDERLLSRISGGLVLEIGFPDYDCRLEIVHRTAARRGATLDVGAAREIARCFYFSVRELQGAVNRVLAVQELEGRLVKAEEVVSLLTGLVPSAVSEFGEFLAEVSGTMADVSARLDGDATRAGRSDDTGTGAAAERPAPGTAGIRDPWFLSRERIVWDWPEPQDLVVETLD